MMRGSGEIVAGRTADGQDAHHPIFVLLFIGRLAGIEDLDRRAFRGGAEAFVLSGEPQVPEYRNVQIGGIISRRPKAGAGKNMCRHPGTARAS